MRKYIVAFGIILIFIGVVTSSVSNSYTERTVDSTVSHGYWSTSGYFDINQNLSVQLSPPNAQFILIGMGTFNVTIIDPADNESVFTVRSRNVEGRQVLSNVTVVSTSNSLTADVINLGVGGIVHQSGNYTVIVDKKATYLYPKVPPDVTLTKETVKRDYPYRGILPVGIGILVFGVGLSIWAAKSSGKSGKKR